MVNINVRDDPWYIIMKSVMKYADGLWPNVYALSYVLLAYLSGWYAITLGSVPLNLFGALLLAHSMVIAAYMVHECAHNTVFSSNRANAKLGALLNWFTGACYGDYEDIRHKHFRHHMDRADVVAFDYRPRFASHPVFLKIMRVLEWLYIPAVEIVMHLLVLVVPFILPGRRHRRARVLTVLAARTTVFAVLVLYAPRVAIFYPLAYMVFLTVMRFMDTHQHTYEIFETLEQPRGEEAMQFDRAFEHRNTYSNLFSVRHPWLNLLVLNFGYHNAHHLKPITPWYRLPALHREAFGDNCTQILPIGNLLRAYHRYRVPRMLNADAYDSGVTDDKAVHFIGVDGVSFLTAH
jgi:fatty acid desaturase